MRLRNLIRLILLSLTLAVVAVNGAWADDDDEGLNDAAFDELSAAGVDKYLGEFTPVATSDVGDGWTKHTFDPDFGVTGPNGPVCIAGTAFSAFTPAGDPHKNLIFEQGGGACWQDFYNCNILSEAQEPPAPPFGIFDFAATKKDNPFRNYSIVYMPYCDGSVFTGDNDVPDTSFPFGAVRFHRGLRNQSAAMDLAMATFPKAEKIVVAGSSAGGVGAAGFAPFLVRFVYGNDVELKVFNDAGPVAVNLDPGNLPAQADIAARAADWDFGKFFPASCTDCDDMGQATEIIQWRLDNDSSICEAFYETEFDGTNRFFTRLLFDPVGFRNLVVTEHGLLNDAHPSRYKRFIVGGGDTSHGAFQTPLFNFQTSNGIELDRWTKKFLKAECEDDDDDTGWVDTVE